MTSIRRPTLSPSDKKDAHRNTALVEDVSDTCQPHQSTPNPDDIIHMFPDPNDDEIANNGQNISTFPPPYLHSNSRVHFKLPDSTTFTNGFLTKSSSSSSWSFYKGTSRKTAPITLEPDLLSSLFSRGHIRRGFHQTPARVPPPVDTLLSPLPSWVINNKITVKLPYEFHFRREYISQDADKFLFQEGLKRSLIKDTFPLTLPTIQTLIDSKAILKGHNHRLSEPILQSTTPRLRTVDTVLQPTPSKIKLTESDLRKGFAAIRAQVLAPFINTYQTRSPLQKVTHQKSLTLAR